MEVKQIAELVNGVLSQVSQGTELLTEDLSNLVTVGTTVIDASWKDNYVRGVTDRIGREVFVNRIYKGRLPNVLKDSWEYGSIKRKIRVKGYPKPQVNESWELKNNASYDPNIFYAPEVAEKFFNSMTSYEIPISITDIQLRESFTTPQNMNAFISMIWSWIENGFTLIYDELIQRTINSFIADTIYSEYPSADYSSKSGVKAINLLKEYNDEYGENLDANTAYRDPEFIRFASFRMGTMIKRLGAFTTIYNIEGTEKFTPKEDLHVVLLDDFNEAAKIYLYGDTFHNDFVELEYNDTVPFWQGTGNAFNFSSISKINVTSASGHSVEIGGILGVMFDHEALGVMRMNRRAPTGYNPRGEFFNYFNKADAEYFNDLAENFVVFFIA